MASAILFGTTSGGFVVATGAAAHAVLASRQLADKKWDTSGRGGFIGSLRGGAPTAPPKEPTAPPAAAPEEPTAPPAAAPKASGGGGGSAVKTGNVPIGGATTGSALGSPFGRFRGHKPTKLPKGGPKPYDAATSP